MSSNNVSKFETTMKEHEKILNTKIDTNIDDLKFEASISINKTLYPMKIFRRNCRDLGWV